MDALLGPGPNYFRETLAFLVSLVPVAGALALVVASFVEQKRRSKPGASKVHPASKVCPIASHARRAASAETTRTAA